MSDSAAASRRRERTREDEDDRHIRQRTGRGDEEEQQQRILPVRVLAVAAMNNRSRLFIPGKLNFLLGFAANL
eukprot:scaffold2180_cov168-Amphora_coffeaeformis.AAC.8